MTRNLQKIIELSTKADTLEIEEQFGFSCACKMFLTTEEMKIFHFFCEYLQYCEYKFANNELTIIKTNGVKIYYQVEQGGNGYYYAETEPYEVKSDSLTLQEYLKIASDILGEDLGL